MHGVNTVKERHAATAAYQSHTVCRKHVATCKLYTPTVSGDPHSVAYHSLSHS